MVWVCGVLNGLPLRKISTISFSTAPFSPTVTSTPALSSAMLITGPSPSTSTTISGVGGEFASIPGAVPAMIVVIVVPGFPLTSCSVMLTGSASESRMSSSPSVTGV